MPVTVVNKYKLKGPYYTDIQRGTVFGNPHNIGTKFELIERYKRHFNEQMASDTPLRRAVNALRAKHIRGAQINLACTCAPAPCHGDVIKAYIEKDIPSE
jgi:hypothetical protein